MHICEDFLKICCYNFLWTRNYYVFYNSVILNSRWVYVDYNHFHHPIKHKFLQIAVHSYMFF